MSDKETNGQEEMSGNAEENEQEISLEKKQRDPVKLWAGGVLALCLFLFICHLFADKYTPYTADGRIEAFVVPITPQVSGTLVHVRTNNNQPVIVDQELAVIDPTRYELAVQRAQADLQQASQTSAADVSAVTTAQAKVSEAEANLRNAQVKGQRIIKLSRQPRGGFDRPSISRFSSVLLMIMLPVFGGPAARLT